VPAPPAVVTAPSKMPASSPVSNAHVSLLPPMSLRMGIVIVAIRIRIIGIVIIGGGELVAIIIFIRIVCPIICIGRAGD
jgi:hypothetical protein